MYSLLPFETLAGGMQMVCYFFTVVAALMSIVTLRG